MRMIEFTRDLPKETKVSVNVGLISYFSPNEKGTIIYFFGDNRIGVKESYEEIKEKLGVERELNASDYGPIFI
jgi:hypothetical protein